ncbi:MAG TPA: cobalamin-independent methionine synthase II family protein [Steroidobacteraceae bacterium]|jgi:5-methyltetrahydropteroyltriglutamate--homocysteine methyltransferase|nr:cobalamin-independent methionine synthase II family protein [Steroidobacteraceae bacterium]
MKRSTGRILTTHVGALPGPPEVWENPDENPARLGDEVAAVVRAQRDAGIDLVNEGELTKGGNWVTFINKRLAGFEERPLRTSRALLMGSKDWREFDDFYAAAIAGGTLFEQTRAAPNQARRCDHVCTAPIVYTGREALQREIETLRAALGDLDVGDAFLTSTAPASIEAGRLNEYYRSEEEYVYAIAEALRTEYEAIAAAGFVVQIDDAWLAALWDRIGVQMGLEAYESFCMMRVEALNHALRNVPVEQVRYHLCWGSWHGPHAYDIPLSDIVDVMLSVKAQAYLFEAANVRHEHEYRVWETVKLPAGKILAPGVVSHATALIEHPDLVSERIQRFARLVGAENVIASTDCGLGLRCHPQIAWAKLKALSEGARRASAALWP